MLAVAMKSYTVTAEDAESHVEGGVVYHGHVRENAERVFDEWKSMSTASVEMYEDGVVVREVNGDV